MVKQTKVSCGEIVKIDNLDAQSDVPFDLQSKLRQKGAENTNQHRLRTETRRRDASASEDSEEIVESRYKIPTRLTYNFRNQLPQGCNTVKIP